MRHQALAAFGAILFCACGGGGGDDVDARPGFDALARTDRVYVVKQVTLPADQEQVDDSKFEFPGSGYPVNKLGALLQVLMGLVEGIPVQDDLDANFLAGEVLEVFVVRSGPLTADDPGATGSYAVVDDHDVPADPANNWDGQGQFVLPPGGTLEQVFASGTVTDGLAEAHGAIDQNLTFLLPFFAGEEPFASHGQYPVIRAVVTEDGLVGAAGNAVTPAEFETSVLPLVARLFTQAIAENQPKKDQIKALFDSDNDDEVTVEELKNSSTMATLAQPDVDLDEDGTNDHLSQGILFEAVRAELVSE